MALPCPQAIVFWGESVAAETTETGGSGWVGVGRAAGCTNQVRKASSQLSSGCQWAAGSWKIHPSISVSVSPSKTWRKGGGWSRWP